MDDPTGNPEYCIRNNRLYRHILHTLDFNEYHQGEQWKICVPRSDQQRVLTEVHNDPKAGHLGVAKTLVRLARHHYWPGMLRMGTQHVRNCDSCQKFKAQQQVPAGAMQATNVETPWEMVSIDLVGPLVRSNTGNTWLLVMQDRFTKWIKLTPLKKATSQAINTGVKDQICLRHGCPATIVSDNGRQFIGKELKTFLQEMHIAHRLTPP